MKEMKILNILLRGTTDHGNPPKKGKRKKEKGKKFQVEN